jgi:transcriptional regulator with XRE-family HTH domain
MLPTETKVYLDGNKVRRLRMVRGLTIRKLAEESGLATSTIARIEKEGRHEHFHAPTLKNLADALGVDPLELIGE